MCIREDIDGTWLRSICRDPCRAVGSVKSGISEASFRLPTPPPPPKFEHVSPLLLISHLIHLEGRSYSALVIVAIVFYLLPMLYFVGMGLSISTWSEICCLRIDVFSSLYHLVALMPFSQSSLRAAYCKTAAMGIKVCPMIGFTLGHYLSIG